MPAADYSPTQLDWIVRTLLFFAMHTLVCLRLVAECKMAKQSANKILGKQNTLCKVLNNTRQRNKLSKYFKNHSTNEYTQQRI
jgi:hypothetical protein